MRDKFCNETKKLVASDTTLATSGTAEGIRTPDLLVRSQTLYPAELQPHTVLRLLIADSSIILAHHLEKCKPFLQKNKKRKN